MSPQTGARDLGLHLLRFVMMEALLPRDEVLAWLRDLVDALSVFVADVERYRAAVTEPLHAALALDHGIAVHRASLAWARATWEMLASAPPRLAARALLDAPTP